MHRLAVLELESNKAVLHQAERVRLLLGKRQTSQCLNLHIFASKPLSCSLGVRHTVRYILFSFYCGKVKRWQSQRLKVGNNLSVFAEVHLDIGRVNHLLFMMARAKDLWIVMGRRKLLAIIDLVKRSINNLDSFLLFLLHLCVLILQVLYIFF